MYDVVRGPMMWISAAVCVGGLIYQAVGILRITKRSDEPYFAPQKPKAPVSVRIKGFFTRFIAAFDPIRVRVCLKGTILGNQPHLALLTAVFHLCLLLTPVFLVGHSVLLHESWGFSICSFPERITDILTVVVVACACVFLARRLFVRRVRSVTSLSDYLLLLITLAPFVTGFIAYHQLLDYRTVMLMHMLSGQLMLVAVGVTKLGHMIFFFIARFFIGSEYSFGGARSW